MTLKRAGRGHDPEGIGNTPPGSLTVECPACPHPGRNLPENWRDAGPLMYVTFSPFIFDTSNDLHSGFFIFYMFRSTLTLS
jgi:hypothetical protein